MNEKFFLDRLGNKEYREWLMEVIRLEIAVSDIEESLQKARESLVKQRLLEPEV